MYEGEKKKRKNLFDASLNSKLVCPSGPVGFKTPSFHSPGGG